MIHRLSIPDTIEGNQSVRVLEWHKTVGDSVVPGQLVVEVETHKALIEIRAGQPGVLRERHYAEGEWCPLGSVLALLSDTPDEALTDQVGEWAADFLIG